MPTPYQPPRRHAGASVEATYTMTASGTSGSTCPGATPGPPSLKQRQLQRLRLALRAFPGVYLTMPAELHDVAAKEFDHPFPRITPRAKANVEEYFAELFSAYMFDQAAFQAYDQGRYDLFRAIRKTSGVRP